MSKIKILIVDDHPVVREGLCSMLSRQPDFEVAGEAKDGVEAIQRITDLHPDILLTDFKMPGIDGDEAIRRIRYIDPHIRVVVLTTYDNEEYIFKSIEAGAQAYLLKDAPREDIFNAIRSVYNGESFIQPSITNKVLERFRTLSRQVKDLGPFSSRELEVLTLMARGVSNREIAITLCIGESTVKTHIQNVFQKLQVNNRLEAVNEAVKMGFLHS
jgi:DNA-binding NarL/FixJ family response regulator